MKLLVLDWGAYTLPDINECLTANHVHCRNIYYYFDNKYKDDFFCRHFSEYLTSDSYDAVFTVNFFPLVAEICHKYHVKYLSWSFDNPQIALDSTDILGYETNYVFLFDRIQAAHYQKKGHTNVYHLPLAVNPTRLSSLSLTPEEIQMYTADISFVGNLYSSPLPRILSYLDDYHRGYLESISLLQSKLYGRYLIDELLTDGLIDGINQCVRKKLNNPNASLSREQLSFSMATHITREERLLLLGLLSHRYSLNLYSGEVHPVLSRANYLGTANYLTQMPKVFLASRINLNITLKIIQSGIPLRALDILGAGGFLLSNYQEELSENFIPDKELVLYSDIEDAVAKADFYLRHGDIRLKIAKAGQAKVFSEFNYTRQLTTLFRTAGIL